MVSNIQIYGLNESIKASKYPMSTDTYQCTDEITDRTISLGSAERGSGHDNFLNGCIVQFDLTATNKFWVEAERYHFLDFVSSQSTMHRIAKFNIDNSYIKYTDEFMINRMNELIENYKNDPTPENYLIVLYSNPSGFRLTARMTTNYRQLKTIYYQRKDHRLPEWREFCEWTTTLPYMKDFLKLKEKEVN